MTINELIDKLNKCCKENKICDVDSICMEMFDELQALEFYYIDSVGYDEHRWYVLTTGVYNVTIEGVNYYIGCNEVETIKSEAMEYSDCIDYLEFFEMEKVNIVSYQPKPKNIEA